MTQANRARDELDSQVDASIHPNRARLHMKRVPAWAVVAVVAIFAGAVAYVLAR